MFLFFLVDTRETISEKESAKTYHRLVSLDKVSNYPLPMIHSFYRINYIEKIGSGNLLIYLFGLYAHMF